MPELPDIQIYLERLTAHVGGKTLTGLRIPGPFRLRTVQPKPQEVIGRKIVGFRRLGKRIVFEMQDDLFLVLHLMFAGRSCPVASAARGLAPHARGSRRTSSPRRLTPRQGSANPIGVDDVPGQASSVAKAAMRSLRPCNPQGGKERSFFRCWCVRFMRKVNV